MSETYPAIAAANTWPPREGRRFFLLWIGATLLGWIALRVIGFAGSMSGGPTAWRDYFWLNAIPSCAVGLFQGWLLFGRGPRMIGWGILPATHVAVIYLARAGRTTSLSTWFGFSSIVTTVIATLLLVGVRRKPWLWLFINLGVLVVNQLFSLAFVGGFGLPGLDRVASNMNALLGLPSALALSGMFLFTSISSGIWLGGAMLEAAALAWWMLPIRTPAQVPALPSTALGRD